MIYCMSDIHGEADRFHAMLELIEFKPEDELYIIGDVIDRKPGGVDLLLEVMDAPNMTMIIGNHEEMLLRTIGPHNEVGARQLWKQNGGDVTYRDLIYKRDQHTRNRVLVFISELPDHMRLKVNNHEYVLVHGFAASTREDRIWSRPEADWEFFSESVTVICGHTPTSYLTGNFDEPYHIFQGNGWLDIDCGCGNKTEHRRLACLRLDDMREFYI